MLVDIRNILSLLVLSLDFKQPYIEQFEPIIFKTKKL